jgi:carbon storage regulator
MLILTRCIAEGMSIGKGIHLKVLGIRGKQVRLGIEAPPHLEIFRDELWGAEAQRLPPEGFQENLALSKKRG